MTPDLSGRLALVTGASGKLGPVWIAALAGAGARVVGVDVRGGEIEGAESVEIADVTDREALLALRERVGAPDVLVNNAGIDQPPSGDAGGVAIEDVPFDDFRRVLDVNLAGTFLVTQVFGSAMRDAGRGSIVNIGSLYATIAPDPRMYDHLDLEPPFLKPPAYGASKAGVLGLTRYFARLWGPARRAGERALARRRPRRPGSGVPAQVHGARRRSAGSPRAPISTGPLLFLASDESRYVTGHELRVDGGFTA